MTKKTVATNFLHAYNLLFSLKNGIHIHVSTIHSLFKGWYISSSLWLQLIVIDSDASIVRLLLKKDELAKMR